MSLLLLLLLLSVLLLPLSLPLLPLTWLLRSASARMCLGATSPPEVHGGAHFADCLTLLLSHQNVFSSATFAQLPVSGTAGHVKLAWC
mmetsp:Transcript_8058/g.23931  ORF Transcript_8058/g.23931 Transcript_8058/m.23931 type:complete len:88 (-) Transcript_8058:230-493(-)